MLSYVAAFACVLNWGIVVPRALAAGRASVEEWKQTEESNAKMDFVVQGGSKTRTKQLHQTVVLLVVITTASLICNALLSIR